jgi:hypothetical protein
MKRILNRGFAHLMKNCRLGDTVEAVDGVWLRGDEACEGKFWKAVMGRPGSAVDVRIQNAITVSRILGLESQGLEVPCNLKVDSQV